MSERREVSTTSVRGKIADSLPFKESCAGDFHVSRVRDMIRIEFGRYYVCWLNDDEAGAFATKILRASGVTELAIGPP